MASQPLPYRPHCLAKNDRNRAMIADYLGGMSRTAVAEKYGVGVNRVRTLFYKHRIVLAPDERAARMFAGAEASRTMSPGRPPVWPDCPPELADDYRLLRRKRFSAAEARAMLDPGFRHDAR